MQVTQIPLVCLLKQAQTDGIVNSSSYVCCEEKTGTSGQRREAIPIPSRGYLDIISLVVSIIRTYVYNPGTCKMMPGRGNLL